MGDRGSTPEALGCWVEEDPTGGDLGEVKGCDEGCDEEDEKMSCLNIRVDISFV